MSHHIRNKSSYLPKIYSLSLLFTISFLTFSFTTSQLQEEQSWDRQQYAQISAEDFRKEATLNQKFDTEKIDYALINACLFFLANEQRIKQGLKPLVYAPQLEIVAWHHSKMMLELDFFDHSNLKNSGRASTQQRAKLAGIDNPFIAENIAYQGASLGKSTYLKIAEVFINQWMNSPGHRNNILSDKALQMGCGLYTDGKKWYATQCFQWFREIKPIQGQDKLP